MIRCTAEDWRDYFLRVAPVAPSANRLLSQAMRQWPREEETIWDGFSEAPFLGPRDSIPRKHIPQKPWGAA